MQRKLILTGDGSHSITIPDLNVTYHSIHGAISESLHIFIEAGLNAIQPDKPANQLTIFEMGFGTGLNALLTLIEAEKQNRNIYYVSVDLFPLDTEQIASLNFCKQLQRPDLQSVFEEMHNCEWEKEIPITSHFLIKKLKADLVQVEIPGIFQLIYFDAFDPVAQPELWTNKIFEKIFSVLQPGGILVTYSSKGDVRRAIQAAGFRVEKLPGPKGKRQIVRAVRPL